MNEGPTYYESLLNLYFAGEATEEQMAELHAWVKKDPENKKLFETYARAWDVANMFAAQKHLDLEEVWKENRKRRTPVNNGVQSIMRYSIRYRIAAAVVLLLGLSFFLWMIFSEDNMERMVANSGVMEVVLPDQSKVSLAEGSVLEYPEKFEADERMVYLSGKAYFVVEHLNEKSFIVDCEGTRIKVLGTRFFVGHSAKEDEVEVVLDQGEVAVYFKDSPEQQMILQPDERVEASLANKRIVKKANTDPNYLSWKTQDFVFENTSLKKVFKTLEEAYNVQIIPEEELSGCRLTASFEDQSLTSVMRVIQATFDVRIIQSNGVIRVSGEPCN